MPKRYTDTDKYKKPFIRGLQGAYKLFWDYLYHDCNHAGIWKKDFEMASFCIGLEITESDAKLFLNGRIIETSTEKWFIPKFVEFQYGELVETNRPHISVINTLRKEGVYKEYTSPLQGDKDKDKDKDKVKDKDNIYRRPTLNQIIEYCKETNSHIDPEFFFNHYESTDWIKANGQKVKNWKATIKTWEKRNPKQTGREVRDL